VSTPAEAVGAARRLLGLPADADEPDLDEVRELVAELSERLAEEGEGDAVAAARATQAAELARIEERTAAVDRVLGAVAGLRTITAPAALLSAAPEALCSGSRLDRAVLSLVRDGVMEADELFVRDDPERSAALLAELQEHPVRLEHPLVETEALRRRRATLVTGAGTDPRVDRTTAAIMGWSEYVVAPIAVRSTVVAVLHADVVSGPALDARDAGILWTFATGLAQAYESASLRRTLRHERRQMRRLLRWIDGRSSELADATVELVPRAREDLLPQPEELDGVELRPERDRNGSAVLDAVLTRREIEILRLLADGLTNRAIATELVISGGTVKFHVNSILRKLHVANRAEAVARYYALLDARR
jgi:DNA-binding CsgD family transcriptional regulator